VSLAPIAVVIKKKKPSSVSSWGLRIPEWASWAVGSSLDLEYFLHVYEGKSMLF
jgi:hypothetical protein